MLTETDLDFTLAWWQSAFHSSPNNDKAKMGIRTYDEAANLTSSQFSTMIATQHHVWTQRTHLGVIPAGTAYLHVVMEIQRFEGSNNDGYIDDITLDIEGLGSIPLTNPGAEDGVTGWTNEVGGLSFKTSDPLPHTGARYFFGGSGIALTRAYQQIGDLVNEVAPDFVDSVGGTVFAPSIATGVIRPVLASSGESSVFGPSVESTLVISDRERNPYPSHSLAVDPDEQQRTLRDQHNKTQAGDSTFDYGLLFRSTPDKLYTLGALGRFYHDDFGLIHARYIRIGDWVTRPVQGCPVGFHEDSDTVDWLVTNDIEESNADLVCGVAFFADAEEGRYGWVVVDGANPTAIPTASEIIPAPDAPFTWADTGTIGINTVGKVVGRRVGRATNSLIGRGQLYIRIEPISPASLAQLIADSLEELTTTITSQGTRLTTVESQIAVLQGVDAGFTTELTTLTQRIGNEERLRANAINAIYNLLGTTDWTTTIDTIADQLRAEFAAADSLVQATTDTALTKANLALTTLGSLNVAGLRTDLDNLTILVGANGDAITAHNARITLLETAVDSFAYDDSTPPTNGQALVFDSVTNKFKPGTVSGSGGAGAGSNYSLLAMLTGPTAGIFDFTGLNLAAYDEIEIEMNDIQFSVIGMPGFKARIAGVLTTTQMYGSHRSVSSGANTESGSVAGGAGFPLLDGTSTAWQVVATGTAALANYTGRIRIQNPNSTKHKIFSLQGTTSQGNTSAEVETNGGGAIRDGGVLNGFQIYSEVGTISAGIVKIWGISKGNAIAAASGAAWATIGTHDFATTPQATKEFDVTGFKELVITVDQAVHAAAVQRCLQFSVDAGATWFTTSGDYQDVSAAGAGTNNMALFGHTTATTAARNSLFHIMDNVGANPVNINIPTRTLQQIFRGSALPINRVRLVGVTSGTTVSALNFTSGTVRCYGRSAQASSAWSLLATVSPAAVANVDFTNLSQYNEVLLIARAITASISGTRRMLVSVDNGATFYSLAANYQFVSDGGVEANNTGVNYSGATTAARTLVAHIKNTKGPVKVISTLAIGGKDFLFAASPLDINAIRVDQATGGTISGGPIYLYGR